MKRRNFLNSFLKASLIGSSVTMIPKDVYAREMDKLYEVIKFDLPASPYHIYSTNQSFKSILSKSTSFPTAIKTRVLEYSPGKSIWSVGEGETSIDLNFPNLRGKGFTPVHIFHGPQTEVYGQYIQQVIGKVGIIKGFDGRYYRVYPNFSKIFTARYHCYGLPAEDYKTVSCRYCNESYVYQYFRAECSGNSYKLYAWLDRCPSSKTGFHDNIKGRRPDPCAMSTEDISIGETW